MTSRRSFLQRFIGTCAALPLVGKLRIPEAAVTPSPAVQMPTELPKMAAEETNFTTGIYFDGEDFWLKTSLGTFESLDWHPTKRDLKPVISQLGKRLA